MKYFGLLFHQSLILFASFQLGFGEQFVNDLEVQLVTFDGFPGMEERSWQRVILSKEKKTFKYIFKNDELNRLCGGVIPWFHIEIIEVFGRVVQFSLIRGAQQFFVNLMFTVKCSAQVFVEDVRSQQKKKYGRKLPVAVLLQYQIPEENSQNNAEADSQNNPAGDSPSNAILVDDSDDDEDNQEPLKLLASNPKFFTKDLSEHWFPNQKTINFSVYARNIPIANRGFVLVLLSGRFNISQRIGTDTYILCAFNITTHYFIALFHNDESATDFYATVEPYLNYQIPCPTDWYKPEISDKLKTATY